MPFRVDSNIGQIRDAVSGQRERFPALRDKVLQRSGFYLLAQQKAHFDALVKTGTSNGVTWPRPAESTLRKRQALARRGLLANADPENVGVESGRLARGFRFRVRGNRVLLVNITPYAGAFSVRRPIFPPSVPAAWQAGCEAITQQVIDKEVK